MVVVYQKNLIYSGFDWKIPVYVTVPQQTITSTANTTIYVPVSGYAVLNLYFQNTSTVTVAVNVYDGSTPLFTLFVPPNTATVVNDVVFRTNVMLVTQSGEIYVFATGIDGYNPVE